MAKLCTVERGAEFLGVSKQRMYELVRRNMIPGVVKIGRQVRIDLEELEVWAKNGGRALPGGWKNEADDELRDPKESYGL